MKKQLFILTLAVSSLLMGSTYAVDVQTAAAPEIVVVAQTQVVAAMPALNELDMQAAFQGDVQAMEFAALSEQEMVETQGAWWPRRLWARVAIFTAAIACVAYTGGACTAVVAF